MNELHQDHLPTTPHRKIALPKMVASALRHPTLEIWIQKSRSELHLDHLPKTVLKMHLPKTAAIALYLRIFVTLKSNLRSEPHRDRLPTMLHRTLHRMLHRMLHRPHHRNLLRMVQMAILRDHHSIRGMMLRLFRWCGW
jgi:hypothetical protein